MHRSSQAAASGGRLSPQFPAPPARCGSVATASAGVCAASQQEAVSVSTGEDGPRLSVRRQGLPLSAWPDHLLVLVLRQLTPVELVACRRVCQQWYRVASDPGLRAHSLMASYPPAHRRQLQQALAPDRARQYLAPWSDSLAPESARRRTLESRMAEGMSSRDIFFSLTREMNSTRHLSCMPGDRVSYGHNRPSWLVCSPDAALCALAFTPHGQPYLQVNRVELWRLDGSALVLQLSTAELGRLYALQFGSDSRTLRALDDQGWQHLWQVAADTRLWREAGQSRLCPPPVLALSLSPDQCYLAIARPGEVWVLIATGNNSWQLQWTWPWPDSCRRPADRRGLPLENSWHQLQWSHDGRQLVLSVKDEVFFAGRKGALWQELLHMEDDRGLAIGSEVLHKEVLEPHAPLLALAVREPEPARGSFWLLPALLSGWRRPMLRVRVVLLCADPDRGWSAVTSRLAGRYNRFTPFPLVFSPDGQHLAFSDTGAAEDNRLCVLSADSLPPWQTVQLAVPPVASGRESGRQGSICTISFSANGRFLAAEESLPAMPSLHIWRRDRQGWIPFVSTASGFLGRFLFSPDGFHCVLAYGAEGTLQLWGPGPEGQYLQKARWEHGNVIQMMRFTPDGTRLLTTSLSSREAEGVRPGVLCCLQLVPEAADSETAAGSAGLTPWSGHQNGLA